MPFFRALPFFKTWPFAANQTMKQSFSLSLYCKGNARETAWHCCTPIALLSAVFQCHTVLTCQLASFSPLFQLLSPIYALFKAILQPFFKAILQPFFKAISQPFFKAISMPFFKAISMPFFKAISPSWTFVYWAPIFKIGPTSLEGVSPFPSTFPAPNPPVWFAQVPPPQPGITGHSLAVQVLPVGHGLLHGPRKRGSHQHV